ncbi:tetratricopeptide repeat protein [Ancylostoma caninum]|uniref:Tetratricopeptide repeat protein n=1 Tax=Ancylostoma caninum TaxID=29170 RepID=A0A368GQ86_ANCCA|nr:tetratricopeptide repeat protein [Ancylostoma caninum]
MSLNSTAADVASATKLNGRAFVADLQWLLTCCEERFLTDTSKWILEIMAYCPEAWIRSFAETASDIPSTSTSNPATGSIQWPIVTPENRNLLFGKNLLVNRDFARASFFLQKSKSIGAVERFLYYWSKYLGCIRTRLENDAEAIDRKAVQHTDDRNLADLLRDIGREDRSSDVFLLYLEGKIQAALGVPKAAAATMKGVLKMESRFWPAWQELVQLIDKVDDIAVCKALCKLSPDSSWMPDWFESLALLRFHMDSDALKKAEQLISRGLPGIPMILTQIAACSNHLHDHEKTVEVFKSIRAMDPLRIDYMNLYSDSLYIRGDRVQLCDLAHSFFETHKFSFETCCIVGNYYGLRRENEQAIRFFQRALRLNPGVASIWVLVGHEFMELKNNAAACMSYRRAIEVDPQDYRGWYGLGQMYDIIKMPTYSLFYYQQAHLCKPQDSRMLVALGDVYQKMGRLRNAEKCFISAFKYGDVEGTALWMLAKLYESENQMQRAARSYEEYLREYQEIEESDENVVYCVQFLAKHYLEQRDVEKAIYYGQKCLEHDSISEEGRFVLRTAEAMKEQQEKEKSSEARPVDDSFYSTGFDITQASRTRVVTFLDLRITDNYVDLDLSKDSNS